MIAQAGGRLPPRSHDHRHRPRRRDKKAHGGGRPLRPTKPRHLDLPGRGQVPEELESRQKRDAEAKRQAEWEEQGNLQEKRQFTGGGDPAPQAPPEKKRRAPARRGRTGRRRRSGTRARERTAARSRSHTARSTVTTAVARTDDRMHRFATTTTEPAARPVVRPSPKRGGLRFSQRIAAPTRRAPSGRPSESNDNDDAKPSTEGVVMSDIQRPRRTISPATDASRLQVAEHRDLDLDADAGSIRDGTSALNKKLGY